MASAVKKYIVIHHSATKDGETFSWDAIRKYHQEVKKFYDIGYHAGIERVRLNYEVMLGRMPDSDGAHCKDAGMNRQGIGICLVGNFDEEKPAVRQLLKALDVVRYFMRTYGIPYKRVIGHCEAQALAGIAMPQRKTCPGTLFDMERFRASLV